MCSFLICTSLFIPSGVNSLLAAFRLHAPSIHERARRRWICISPPRARRASSIGRHFYVAVSASRSGKASVPRIFPIAVATAALPSSSAAVSVSIMAAETKPAFIARPLSFSFSVTLPRVRALHRDWSIIRYKRVNRARRSIDGRLSPGWRALPWNCLPIRAHKCRDEGFLFSRSVCTSISQPFPPIYLFLAPSSSRSPFSAPPTCSGGGDGGSLRPSPSIFSPKVPHLRG